MRITRCILAGLLIGISPFVQGQSAPPTITGPLSLVVPYPAGGASDITARIVSQPLGGQLDKTVVVENIGGATGSIAAQKILNGPANGRMLYQGSQNELILPALTIKRTRYQPDDFEIVHPVTTTRLVLVVRKGLPVNTLQEFIDLSRARSASDPLTYGSPGAGSLYHLISDAMAKLGGFNYIHVPYRGSTPLMQDLIGDRIDFTVMAFSTTMLASVQTGRYRIIANLSKDKPRELSDMPCVCDVPMFQDLDYTSKSGYYVKKGTPQSIRHLLNSAIGNVVTSPSVIKALEGDGRRVSERMPIATADSFYRAEVVKYQRIVKMTGFKPIE